MHTPVLLKETIALLDPKEGEFIIDGTLNGGGYAEEILKRIGGKGKFLGIDWDKKILEETKTKIASMSHVAFSIFHNDNFANIPKILEKENLSKADGLVLDLGFSTEQIENSGRGFSFQKDEPLIMTYSDEMEPVKEILKKINEKELAEIIKNLSQERFAKRIARAIKQEKNIETSGELASVIVKAVPRNYEGRRMHPAARTFLALRMYANRELENLETVLKNLKSILKPGGRVAIVSFQSMEDRIVKNYFRNMSREKQLKILTKKPIIPTREEVVSNPKARSGKLRGAALIPNP